jgi:hypothetical protein
MMRLACQPIALRADKEDGVDGRFFARRFDCNRLETEVDVLNCSRYVELWLVGARKRKRSRDQDVANWNRCCQTLAKYRLSELSRSTVEKWHAQVGEKRGPFAVNRCLALLATVLNAAIDNDEIPDYQGPNLRRLFRHSGGQKSPPQAGHRES